jgi:PAS domain S-box-containing protein
MTQNHRTSIRLLYVADDAGGEDEFHQVLDQQSAISIIAATGMEMTLDHLAEGVDCVVVSHGQGINGITVLETVREHYPDLPVVLHAPDNGTLLSRAVAADVSEYVPCTATDASKLLVERIQSVANDVSQFRSDGTSQIPIENLGLREKLRLKEQAMEEAPVGIAISDADQPDNPLIYVNDAFEELTGYAKEEVVGRNCRFLQGEESGRETVAAMREAIDLEEPVSVELVNYRKNGEKFWNKVDIAPIHDEDGEATNYVGFQTDVTARKEAEFEVKRERRQLEHLLNRINGLIHDIHGDLVRAVSRDDVGSAVCERIAATDAYEFCWIGEPDLSRDAIVANTQAGAWTPDITDLEIDLTTESPDPFPVLEAYETEQVQVVEDPNKLSVIVEESSWIVGDDLEGIAAIPLVYRETLYGVLVVYTTETNALNDRETIVLEALGRATATAINALERERIITADNIIELEFEIRDRDFFFVDLSASHDSGIEYNGSIYQKDGSVLMYFTTDIDPSMVEESIENHTNIEDMTIVNEHEGGNLIKFIVGKKSIITTLAERGARTRSMEVVDGTGHMSVELPTEADARSIVALLQERYPNAELAAYRERKRPPETKQEFIGKFKENLTERQLSALQIAYVSGFYEWKRPVSGNELAEAMDITRSTFHQHLRAAERKLIAELFN